MSTLAEADPKVLTELAQARMPFGRYDGTLIIDLPERYLIWFRHRGFPQGKLGRMMALALEVKTNGLEYLLEPLIVRGH